MKRYQKEGTTAYVAAMLMLAVFAVGILAVLLSGAGVYRRITASTRESYDSRTTARYFAAKVQQSEGAVEVSSFGDGDALVLRQTIGQEEFVTRVYCYEGWLWELFTPAAGEFLPEDGEKLLPLGDLKAEKNGGLLTLTVTDTAGNPKMLKLRLPGEVQP